MSNNKTDAMLERRLREYLKLQGFGTNTQRTLKACALKYMELNEIKPPDLLSNKRIRVWLRSLNADPTETYFKVASVARSHGHKVGARRKKVQKEQEVNPALKKYSPVISKGYIYQIRKINTETVYIGSTRNPTRRKNEHFDQLQEQTHHNKNLQQAYNESGKDAFVFELLQTFEYIGNYGLLEIETAFIMKKKKLELYNIERNPLGRKLFPRPTDKN
jgi:hypothetical protein